MLKRIMLWFKRRTLEKRRQRMIRSLEAELQQGYEAMELTRIPLDTTKIDLTKKEKKGPTENPK